MNSKNLFIFNSLVCILFGLPILLAPEAMMRQYMTGEQTLGTFGRFHAMAYGGMLVTFSIVLWLCRETSNPSLERKGLLWSVLVGNIIALYVWVSGYAGGHFNNLLLPSIIIIAVTAIWAAVLLFKKSP